MVSGLFSNPEFIKNSIVMKGTYLPTEKCSAFLSGGDAYFLSDFFIFIAGSYNKKGSHHAI